MQLKLFCLITLLNLQIIYSPITLGINVSSDASVSFEAETDPVSTNNFDPVKVAFKLIAGERQTDQTRRRGGLWITGDKVEALRHLRWIAGQYDSEMVTVDGSGQVHLNERLIARAAGVGDSASPQDYLNVLKYIHSNDGLLLLVQVTEGPWRYRLHISDKAPTLGNDIRVPSVLNLDNNYDSRINPRRPKSKKLDIERPPSGFDSMVAMNPAICWFCPATRQLVPLGQITFHELAEAYAKLALGLDYIGNSSSPGAHDLALERETILKSQRPLSGIVFSDILKCISKSTALEQLNTSGSEALSGSLE